MKKCTAATTYTALPRKPYNVLRVFLALHEARSQLPFPQPVASLDLALDLAVLRSDRAAVGPLPQPRVADSSTANPAVVVLHLAHVVEGVQHVVQNAAGEEHAVDALLLVVGHGELQDSEAGLENAEEALHVLAHALQRLGEGAWEKAMSPSSIGYLLGSMRETHWTEEAKEEDGKGLLVRLKIRA